MELTENHIPLTIAALNARARNAHTRQVPQLLEVTKWWFKTPTLKPTHANAQVWQTYDRVTDVYGNPTGTTI